MAIRAAISTFREMGSDPANTSAAGFVSRRAHLNFLWQCYKNTNFEDVAQWQSYRQAHGPLYRNIRSIYNPTRRLVNFYVSQVYPGVLSEDASALPDGVQLAIPLASDTPDELKIAIAQFWQWSNWQSGNKSMVRFGAAMGSALVEIDDDTLRGKVSANVRKPTLIKDLELDSTGNIKFYSLEYDVEVLDDSRQVIESYTYRKEVDKESFKYFKDDSPFTPEGRQAVEDNIYGFVPAVWCKHIDEGDDWGAPAISGSIGKIDEVNGLASHTHDLVDKRIEEMGIIASSGSVTRLEAQSQANRNRTTDEYSAVVTAAQKNSLTRILKGPEGTTWIPMNSTLNPSEVVPLIEKALMELEQDFPELSMYTELRKMSQVTGPGAARMMGDVAGKVLEVSANYDQQSIKLFGMAVAIGGMRLKEGRDGWRSPTVQQRKFSRYDLTSYAKGDLDFAILPRPLVPMTEADQIDLTGKRLENASKADGLFSEDKRLELAGVSDEKERRAILDARRTVDVTIDNQQ